MKNLLSGFLGGILGAILIAGGFVYASNNHYVGFNPATGVNNIPGQWTDSVTAPQALTISGCSLATPVGQHGGTNVGELLIASGGGGNCTITLADAVVGDGTGIIGYTCIIFDITSQQSYLPTFKQTASTPTSCTVTGAAANGDILVYLMFAFGDA
jgi:hypothetical protein